MRGVGVVIAALLDPARLSVKTRYRTMLNTRRRC